MSKRSTFNEGAALDQHDEEQIMDLTSMAVHIEACATARRNDGRKTWPSVAEFFMLFGECPIVEASELKEYLDAFKQADSREYEKPQYRESNPKIDLLRADGSYIASTNWHRTRKNALAYYKAEKPEMNVARAVLGKR